MRFFTVINCTETLFASVGEITDFAQRLFEHFGIRITNLLFGWKDGKKDKDKSGAYRNIDKICSEVEEVEFENLGYACFSSELRGVSLPDRCIGELNIWGSRSPYTCFSFTLRNNESDTLPEFSAGVLHILGKNDLVHSAFSDELEQEKWPDFFAEGGCGNYLSPYESRIARTIGKSMIDPEGRLPFLFKYTLLNKSIYPFSHSLAGERGGFTELDLTGLGGDMESYQNDPIWAELYDELRRNNIMLPMEEEIWSDSHSG